MYRFNSLDSQPEECLRGDPTVLHTMCFCRFRDSASAKKWIHKLVPKNQDGVLQKWSDGRGSAIKLKRRRQFIEAINQNYDDIDFSVHCISATEAQISRFTQAFYCANPDAITQHLDDEGNNHLAFKINETKQIEFPVRRAARLIWPVYAIEYLKDENQLSGFIFSDRFAGDIRGVKLLNFLLKKTTSDLQLSLPLDPDDSEADFLSDWFAGWANSSKTGSVEAAIQAEFEKVLERTPKKIDWIMTVPQFEFTGAE